MKIDARNFLIDFSDAFNLNCTFIDADFQNIKHFDSGLRNEYYGNEFYENIIKILEELEKDVILLLEDQFLIKYILFLLPKALQSDDDKYCVLGPYATRNFEEVDPKPMTKIKLSKIQLEITKEFYLSLPKLTDEEQMLIALSKILYHITNNDKEIILKRKQVVWEEFGQEFLSGDITTDNINAKEVLKRYQEEAIMLDYIQKGDYKNVLKIVSNFANVKVYTRYRGNVHNAKNALNTLNTLCRISLQKTAVHPVHIDKLSSDMANLIDSCTSESQLTSLNEVIVKSYCNLVLDHSLSDYSPMIREVISYIDFNLKEDLSLSFIAQKLNLNPKSLTTKFTEEVGLRLTQYINEKRIEESLKYLTNSNYSIQNIATMVGFLDDNYYRRVFKNIMDVTPSQYRSKHKIETIF